MSTAAVSSASITQQQYLQTRHSDLKQLQQALKSGDLAGAHHDHGQGLKLRQGAYSPDHFQAVGNRHHEVGEHHVRVLLYQLRETILAVRRRHDVIARFLEKLGQALDEEAFIVDYEDGLHC